MAPGRHAFDFVFKFKERWLLPSVDSPGAHVRYALHAELSAPGRSFARSAHVALFCAGTHDPALFLANGDAAASNAAVKSKSFALGKVRPFFLLLARSANACLGFGSPRKSRKTKRPVQGEMTLKVSAPAAVRPGQGRISE